MMNNKNQNISLQKAPTSFIRKVFLIASKKRTPFLLLFCAAAVTFSTAQVQKKCSYCEMIYQFPNFGGEIITTKNDTLWYDATECMASVIVRGFVKQDTIKNMFSINYLKPTEWLNAKKAYYLQSDEIQSPMSMNISAYKSKADVVSQQKQFGGVILGWDNVIELVNKKWFRK